MKYNGTSLKFLFNIKDIQITFYTNFNFKALESRFEMQFIISNALSKCMKPKLFPRYILPNVAKENKAREFLRNFAFWLAEILITNK